ncbi:MAG: translation initiation factor IF-2 subunit beta [Thermoprotei archaeon]
MSKLSINSYDEMLNRVYSSVSVKPEKYTRYEIPKLTSYNEGAKTIITNFKYAAERLNRKPEELAKFIYKELGAGGNIDNERLILTGRFENEQINTVINLYYKRYVICPVCGKPDTVLIKQKKIVYMKCLACGAESPVPEI